MLTESEKKVFTVLKNYIDKNGFAPSIRELCELTNHPSTSTVHYTLKKLEDKGYIYRPANVARSYKILKAGDEE